MDNPRVKDEPPEYIEYDIPNPDYGPDPDEDPLAEQESSKGSQSIKGHFQVISMFQCSQHGWIKHNGMVWDNDKAVGVMKKQGRDVLRAAWDDPFKDLEIVCKNDFSIRCHRLVLSNVSSLLYVLIQGTMDQDKCTLFLPDFSVKAVRVFLKLCYSMDVETKEEEEYSDELDELLNSLDIDMARSNQQSSENSLIDDWCQGLKKPTVKLLSNSQCLECTKGRGKRRKAVPDKHPVPSKVPKVVNALVLFKCISCNINIATTVIKHNAIQAHVAKTNPGKSMRYQCQSCVENKCVPFGRANPRPKDDLNKKMVCWDCGKTFQSQELIKLHVASHFKTRHKCSCGKEFDSKEEVDKHEEEHSFKFKCADCKMGFRTKQEIVKHTSDYHMTGIPQCKLCPERVAGSMEMHMKSHHSGNEGHVKCDQCSFEGFNNISLRSHRKRCHDVNIVVNSENACLTCGAEFKSRYALRKHIANRCKTFQCAECGTHFENKEELAKHTSLNHLSGVPKCPLCPEKVTVNMGTHIKYHHSGREGHIKCNQCSFEAFNSKSLSSHIKRCHGLKVN